jgi:hypothetical protein
VGLGVLTAEVWRSYSDTLGTTPLDECWVCPDDFYPTTHDTYKKQAAIHPAGFESTIPANEQPKNLALDRAANGTVTLSSLYCEQVVEVEGGGACAGMGREACTGVVWGKVCGQTTGTGTGRALITQLKYQANRE